MKRRKCVIICVTKRLYNDMMSSNFLTFTTKYIFWLTIFKGMLNILSTLNYADPDLIIHFDDEHKTG